LYDAYIIASWSEQMGRENTETERKQGKVVKIREEMKFFPKQGEISKL